MARAIAIGMRVPVARSDVLHRTLPLDPLRQLLKIVGELCHPFRFAAAAEDRAGFVQAMKQATGTVDELLRDVERGYKGRLS